MPWDGCKMSPLNSPQNSLNVYSFEYIKSIRRILKLDFEDHYVALLGEPKWSGRQRIATSTLITFTCEIIVLKGYNILLSNLRT